METGVYSHFLRASCWPYFPLIFNVPLCCVVVHLSAFGFDRFPLVVGRFPLSPNVLPLLLTTSLFLFLCHFSRCGGSPAGGEDVDGVVVSVHHEDGVRERVQSVAATDGRLRPRGRRTRLGDVLASFTGETRTISQGGGISSTQIYQLQIDHIDPRLPS